MTPGILLRRLQTDSVLEEVSVVILDEFHERSLEYDLLIGMLNRIQSEVRNDLRIVVMSATLEADAIVDYLANAAIVKVEGTLFPVRIEHARFGEGGKGRSRNPISQIVDKTAQAIESALVKHEGDLLAFLPGVGEIKQVEHRLGSVCERLRCKVLTLYGDMRAEEQDQVLHSQDSRKVVLATNIAETSLTIEGIRIVLDSGWARVQRIDPRSGLNRLMLEPISQASATQRAGRAGRTAHGICLRLWDEVTGRSRPKQLDPEVLRVELSSAALQLFCWGERDINSFPWVTPPLQTSVDSALHGLEVLEAVSNSTPTDLGHKLATLPVHPRLGKLLLEGKNLGVPQTAALAAAILSERDVVDRQSKNLWQSNSQSHDCDISRRILAITQSRHEMGNALNRSAVANVRRVASQLSKLAFDSAKPVESESLDLLPKALFEAFPDRVARRRTETGNRGIMVGGRGVRLDSSSAVTSGELFLCLDLDAKGSEATVRIATTVDPKWLHGEHLRVGIEKYYNPTLRCVVARNRKYWFDLLLEETPAELETDAETARLLADAAGPQFDRLLPPKDRELQSWLGRLRWLQANMPGADLPNFAPVNAASLIENWCYGLRSLDDLKQLPWPKLLPSILSNDQRTFFTENAPESVTLPSGRRVLLKYEVGSPPILAAKIQEFFGWPTTPKIAGGRIPLLLHLLAPNGRCHQITDDLASFWANTYPTVRKQLRGRYPKHDWPETPKHKK